MSAHVFATRFVVHPTKRGYPVESGRGAVAVGSGSCRLPGAFALVPVPQSDPWFRFHVPLIEPDVRVSRIRLSDKVVMRSHAGSGE